MARDGVLVVPLILLAAVLASYVSSKRREQPYDLQMSNGGGDVQRVSPSLKTAAATKRASEISSQLRERNGWIISTAHVSQCWKLHLDGLLYRIEAFTSAFLEGGPRAPAFVFAVIVRAPRTIKEAQSAPWFEGLRRRLGRGYTIEDVRNGRMRLTRVLRGTSEPSLVLRELRHVAAAVEGKPIPPSRARTRKRLREPHEDMRTILEALDATEWRVGGTTYIRERKMQHNGFRWHVAARFSTMVTSAEGPPGFAGLLGGWSRRGKRSNPIAKAADLLLETGYRELEPTYYQRWHRGLRPRDVDGEIELLEQALDLITARAT